MHLCPGPPELTTKKKEERTQVTAVKENGPLGGGRLYGWCPVRHRQSPGGAALQVGTWFSRTWARTELKIFSLSLGTDVSHRWAWALRTASRERSQSHRERNTTFIEL